MLRPWFANAERVWPSRCPCVFWLLAIAVLPTADLAAADEASAIVSLHTELLPTQKMDGVLPLRLVRELGRQAVLIAARDELGLTTRDETLGEPFPESVIAAKRDVLVKVRFQIGGRTVDPATVEISLTPAEELPPDDDAPAGAGTPTCANFDAHISIADLTKVLSGRSHGELVESLRKLGFEGKAPERNEENAPPDQIEDWLLEANIVSQFTAVQAAHRAIAESGRSQAWLGVLVRGYTHLALLTGHHWKSDSDVFAARALLYAERMVSSDSSDEMALVHRAYARAVLGLHAAALADLDEIAKAESASSTSLRPPAWTEVVRPLCEFDRDALAKIVNRQDRLTPMATFLAFQQTRAFADDRWMAEAARPAVTICPEAFGVYSEMAAEGWPLGLSRMGGGRGPLALARFVPSRIAANAAIPASVKKIAAGDKSAAPEPPSDPNPNDEFSVVPTQIANELICVTQSNEDRAEPTWAALGNLIHEEVFVATANYLSDVTNAVETSQEEFVAGVLPLLGQHRYADYIRGFGVNIYQDQPRFHEIVGSMNFYDLRGNMYPMIARHWRVPDNDGQPCRGSLASWHAFYDRGFVYSEMLEAMQQMGPAKWKYTPPELQTAIADEFAMVSPHAPQRLLLKIDLTEQPSDGQLAEWTQQSSGNPIACLKLGQRHVALGNYKDAILCFEQSIELSPTKDAFVGLAESYRASGEDAMWQPTLERFFEVESLGLEHGLVHQMIARDLIGKEQWEEAKTHAEAAANTWSGWGLKLAADVCEKLEQWDEAEKWFRELSTSYPTYSGQEWYFWCRRTGRGKPEDARQAAAQYFSSDWIKTNDVNRLSLMVFNLLTDNPAGAQEDAKWLYDRYSMEGATMPNRVFHHMAMALVARENGDRELEQQALASVRKTAEAMKDAEPALTTVVLLECQVLDGKALTNEQREVADECLESPSIGPTRRCNHLYFLGRALEFQGQGESAQDYYRRALAYTYYNIDIATVAGARLQNLESEAKPQ